MLKTELVWKYKPRLVNLISQLEKIDKEDVSVGFFSEQGNHPSSPHLNYPELMAIHELREKNDPMRRPVFQVSMRKHGKKVKIQNLSLLKTYVDKSAINRKVSPDKLLEDMGRNIANAIRPTFGDVTMLKPNSDKWAAQKGKNSPMVEFGHLKKALSGRTSIKKNIKRFRK